ncbi:MAG: hypothetical protein HC874_32330 [Richelia sp. SL_2_1]|nr:hypothetical protein [Richelia sp. SL_2_1]
MADVKHKIVLGENTDYEKTIYIDRPKGRKAREMMPKILSFMGKLKDLRQDENDLDSILGLVDAFWSREEFENVLVPYVLGLDNPEGMKFLDENCTMVEIMEAFSSASGFLIEQSFSRRDVQAALGKSTDEAQVEAQ